MRLRNIVILVLVGVGGCAADRGTIRDFRRYEAGQVQSIGEVEYEGDRRSGLTNEYFKNGHLKRIEWSRNGKPLLVVEFHDNGQLKSEERFWRNKIVYGAYYSVDGTLTRQVGEKIHWLAKDDS